jgi:hypothetical protein
MSAHLVEEGVTAMLLPRLAKSGSVRTRWRHEGSIRGLLLLLLHCTAAQLTAAHDAQVTTASMATRSKSLSSKAQKRR